MKKAIIYLSFLFVTALVTGCQKIAVGERYQGGVIVYVDGTGKHGLIAAESDQSLGTQWNNGFNVTTNANGANIGDGQNNTSTIIYYQGHGNYAADICDQLVIDGYSDWFLPSRLELKQLFDQRVQVGNFANDILYWSSTEYNQDAAVAYLFSETNNGEFWSPKTNVYRVRAVRKF